MKDSARKAMWAKNPKFVPAKHYSKDQLETLEDIKNMRGKLCRPKEIKMSPTTFIHATNSDKNWVPPYGYDSVVHLKERMENHKEIDKPFLVLDTKPDPKIYSDKVIKTGMITDHEGRHRSFTAKELGIDKIPVDVYCVKHGILDCVKCRKITEDTIKKATSQNYSESSVDKIIKANYEDAKKELEEREKEKREGKVTREKLQKLFK